MTTPLGLVLTITLYWFVLGVVGGILLRHGKKGLTGVFLLSALGSVALFVISGLSLSQSPSTIIIATGFPNYPFHFNFDALSAFFTLLLSAASIGTGLFSCHYFRNLNPRTQSLICFHYHWFLASMVWVFLAADAYSFLLAWEFMALASYFLIVATNPSSETLQAGFLYFIITHLGALFILISFALLGQGAQDYTFNAMRNAPLIPLYSTIAFICALIGFGAKAGLLPLHAWLPEAHPAAPSPISALMSGVMLKTAIYGIVRFTFDLLSEPGQSWGLIMLILGILTAFLGVILAAMQTDMKRLLAYSSIENLGIIIAALGLSLLFYASEQVVMAALALTAALFHCFNHALFKSLLFLGTGSVLHATGERNLGKLGGLINKMPWVALFVLIGTLAIAGVPPLNGFVSEWLLLQAFLFFPQIHTPYLTMLIPVIAAVFALTIGLSAYVMVKFYGIIFLGKPRETKLTQACDPSFLERCGLGWLALGCIILGIFPGALLNLLSPVTTALLGQSTATLFSQDSWLLIIPLDIAHASYSPIMLFILICFLLLVIYYTIRRFYYRRSRRSAAWDCGFPQQNARMQDTAEGFGQPIERIFTAFIDVKLTCPSPADKKPYYHIQVEDRFWYALYLPVLRLTIFVARWVSKLQHGHINYYLLYSFVTLLILLWWTL